MAWLRSALVFMFALMQMLVGFFPAFFGIEREVGEVVEPLRTPLVPIGYAFAIWGLIYLGNLTFAGFHAIKRHDPMLRWTGWLALGAFAGNTVWVWHQPTFGPGWISFLLLEVILLFAFAAALASRLDVRPGLLGRIAYGSLFALAGWITVASPAGFSLALRFSGAMELSRNGYAEVLPILFGWAAIALILTYIARAWSYIIPILWGLAGVALANTDNPQYALGVAALAAAFPALTLYRKRRLAV